MLQGLQDIRQWRITTENSKVLSLQTSQIYKESYVEIRIKTFEKTEQKSWIVHDCNVASVARHAAGPSDQDQNAYRTYHDKHHVLPKPACLYAPQH